MQKSQNLNPESPKYRWVTNFGSRTQQEVRLNIFAKVTESLTKAGLQHSIKLRIRLNYSTTTTHYTTVPRPHWRSRLDATRATKYCQENLEITNGVRDLRFLQRCFYRIKSCWVLYRVNWQIVPAWSWLWRHNVPPERQWTVHQSTRSNTPEDFNLQMSSHSCYRFTHVSGDSGNHCGTP